MVQLSVWPSWHETPHYVRSSIRFRRRILDGRGFWFIRGGVGRSVRRLRRTRALIVVHRSVHSPQYSTAGLYIKGYATKMGQTPSRVWR
jgi:hypothetical protein